MELKESLIELSKAVAALYETVRTDNKTPLKSLFALNEFIENAYEFDVIVFADINKFKNINSEHGYSKGDFAIEKVGELMFQFFVEQLQVEAFHISGDEFLLVLKSDILSQFKDNCRHFENVKVELFDNNESRFFTVSVSFGIALKEENIDFQELKSRAETACKKAKTLGNGKFFEWNTKLEQKKLAELRANCTKCNVAIEVSFPATNKLEFLVCPICDAQMTLK